VAGRSAGAVVQPGATVGARTYCPVSGVEFVVRPDGPRRELADQTLHFCCESCAVFFSEHREQVLAARGMRPPR
jgi:hypothetical protein